MHATELLSRSIDNQGVIYFPYSFAWFDSEWTDEEKDKIKAVIDPHVPERVDARFNNWRFTKVRNVYFLARRATWIEPIAARSADGLAERIRVFYEN